MKLACSTALVLLALAPLTGCGDDEGEGRVVGSLVVPACDDGEDRDYTCEADVALEACDAFQLTFDFFALDRLDDAVRINLQQGGRPFGLADGLLIQIRDVRQLRGRIGQSLPIGRTTNVRAALGVFDRCPDTTQNFELTGSMTFTRFGVESGDRVSGTLDRLEVRDGRAGEVLGFLRGDFDFTVRVGPPYQRFTR